MEIKACPNCGSRRIYQGRMGDGVLTGYTSRDVCRDCGYQGMPIIFDSEKEYKKFLKGKSLGKKSLKSLEEIKDKPKKILKRERPIGVSILAFVLILLAVISIYFYITLLAARPPTLLWIYYISIFVISAVILPHGFIKRKGWSWTVGGVLFALSIPIGLIFLYYLTRPHVKAYFGMT